MINQPFTTLNNGINMPLLGLGVYDMYGKQAEQAVSDALEIGYRLVDTAAMYGNEDEIGNAIRNSNIPRSEIFVTTKVADSAQGYEPTLKAFDNSLEKLQMDYVDLYLIHWPVKAKRKDTWLALEKLYADKRVRAIGVANYLVPFLEEMKFYQSVIPAVDQVEFTPWLFRKDLLSIASESKYNYNRIHPSPGVKNWMIKGCRSFVKNTTKHQRRLCCDGILIMAFPPFLNHPIKRDYKKILISWIFLYQQKRYCIWIVSMRISEFVMTRWNCCSPL